MLFRSSNVLDYVSTAADASEIVVKTGQTVAFPAEGEGDLRVESPSGVVTQVPEVGGRHLVRDFSEAGIYKVGSGADQKNVYVNLRSDRESDVRPEDFISVAGEKVVAKSEFVRFADLWRPMALFALLVLAGEWWFYARRS